MVRREVNTSTTASWNSFAGEPRSPFVYSERRNGRLIFRNMACLVPAVPSVHKSKPSGSGLFLMCSNYCCQQIGYVENLQADSKVFVVFLGLGTMWSHSSYFLCLIILWVCRDKNRMTKIKLYCRRQPAAMSCCCVDCSQEQKAARWKGKGRCKCQGTLACSGIDFSVHIDPSQPGNNHNNHSSSCLSH